MAADALTVQIDALNFELVREVIGALGEAIEFIPTDAPLRARLPEIYARADRAKTVYDDRMQGELKVRSDAAFKMARFAHHLISDRGFTRALAAKELARYAREFDRTMAEEALGDARSLR